MTVTVIVGLQWGDEGKGKVVDYYAQHADYIVRYNGGSNAGHTVVVGYKTYRFHILPSGIIHEGKTAVIGNGVVVEPGVLLSELEALKKNRIAFLKISERANVVLPYHTAMDRVEERLKGRLKSGTTGRGIGPAYEDKVGRFGIRMIDLLDRKELESKLNVLVKLKQIILNAFGEGVVLKKSELLQTLLQYGKRLRPYITDTSSLLLTAISENKNILLEGAQGTHLDIDHGIYPYGTSSNTIAGGACTGAGIPPTKINKIIGVAKAYTTRVGEGPFPTELKTSAGKHLLEFGQEYGTTTGRPRRCGWLDLVMLDYSIRLNDVSAIALTKLDVLAGLSKIKICTAYKYEDKLIRTFPTSMRVLSACKPVYKEFAGWSKTEMRFNKFDYSELPTNACNYIEFIEKSLKVPVELISVGAGRSATIIKSE